MQAFSLKAEGKENVLAGGFQDSPPPLLQSTTPAARCSGAEEGDGVHRDGANGQIRYKVLTRAR